MNFRQLIALAPGFASDDCELRYRNSGYLQVEEGAGLVLRF
ncbi:hypothetical protein [Marinobacter sp.]